MPTPSFILPSAPVYEEGTLYGLELYGSNFVPSPMSFTRATTATRVNADGLVELVPYNFLSYSEDFSANWALYQTTRTPGQIDPFGGNKAIKLQYNTTLGIHTIRQGISLTGSNAHSVYAKAGELQFLQIASAQNVEEHANFNLANGTIGTYGTFASQVQIENVGNGWYRCSVVFTNGSNSINCAIATSASMGWYGVNNFAGANATDGLYLYGAQINAGSLLPYLKTITRLNRPRVDFSLPGCPNLLLEPQRTNVATYSEDITQWAGSLSVTANNTISPDGTQNADKVTSSGSTQTRYKSFSGNANCTASIFAKKVDSDYILISYGQPSTRYAIFRFSDGVCTTATSGITTTSTNYGNGWWRFSMSTTSLSAGYIELCPNASGTSRNSAGSCYVWGAQYENLASYATSYIPTTTASVTRNQDLCSKTGISSLIGQTEGTLFGEFTYSRDDGGTRRLLSLTDGGTTNRITTYVDSNDKISIYIVDSSSVQVDIRGLVALVVGTTYKYAIAYKLNDVKLYVNGVEDGSDTSATIPSCSQLYVGSENGNNPSYFNWKQVLLFPTRLTDDQLEALTGEGFNTYAEMASYYNYTLQ